MCSDSTTTSSSRLVLFPSLFSLPNLLPRRSLFLRNIHFVKPIIHYTATFVAKMIFPSFSKVAALLLATQALALPVENLLEERAQNVVIGYRTVSKVCYSTRHLVLASSTHSDRTICRSKPIDTTKLVPSPMMGTKLALKLVPAFTPPLSVVAGQEARTAGECWKRDTVRV